MIDTPENQVTTETDEVKAEAEADRLFAEAAEAREGSQDEGSDDAGKETAASKTGDEDDQGEQPGSVGNADEPGKGKDAAASAPASGSGEFDWSSADPAARAAYEAAQQQFEHKLKSANGRVSVLDRKLNEVRSQSGGSGEQEQPRKPLKELLAKETVDELTSEYPDLKPILDTLAEVVSRVDGVATEVGEVKSATVALANSPHEAALNQAVPNWLDLARDDRFLGWVDDQPKKVRDAVHANWDAITNANEAAEVFKSFEQAIAPKQHEDAGGGEPSKRDRQQSGARAARVTAPTSAGGDSDDPEVIFAQAAAKKDRARSSNRF